jgi:hypothetical protein
MYENAIENYLVTGVEAKGGICPKLVDVGRKGFPDRTVLLDGEMIFVETKTKGGKIASWQRRYHSDLRMLGYRVEVLWTVLQVDEFLSTI